MSSESVFVLFGTLCEMIGRIIYNFLYN